MSEINCLVIVNNNEEEFLLNMDTEVTFSMFNDEVRKCFNSKNDGEDTIRYSYLDNEDDRITFGSDMEFKEFLNFASTNEITTIFATNANPINAEASIPQVNSSSEVEKESTAENSPKEQPNESQSNELKPNFNIKYQIPFPRNVPTTAHKEENPQSEEPLRVICDNCDQEIKNIRYKCLQCLNFDLCENCELLKSQSEDYQQVHPHSHVFAKIYAPFQRQVLQPSIGRPSIHLRRSSRPRNNFVYSTLMNNHPVLNNRDNNNSSISNDNTCTVDSIHNQSNGSERRGESISHLENRIQSLQNEIAQIKLALPLPSAHPE